MLLELLLAAVFLAAAVGKARDPREAAAYVRPLVGRRDRATARLLGVAEVVLASAFVAAVLSAEAGQWAGGAAIAFLVVTTVAHATLIARGRPPQCHCFGALDRRGRPREAAWESALLVARNAALVVASAAVAHATMQVAATAAGAIATIIAAGLIASVMRERRHLKGKPHPLKEVYAHQILNLVAQTWWVDGRPRRL